MSSPTVEHAYRPPILSGPDLQRRVDALQRWRRHSALIRLLRVLLPLVIAVSFVGLTGWAAVNTFILHLGANQNANTEIRMVNPKFFGRDSARRPFFLGAATAVRDNSDIRKIYLDRPMALMGDPAVKQTKVTANKGVYHEDTRILTLDGQVHLHDTGGNDFVSEHAVVDTAASNLDGPAHIDGHGSFGRISSSSYAIRNGGAEVFFTGKVQARIEQGAQAQPAPQSGQPAGAALRGSR